jgi:hypothetical protein
MLPLYFEPKNLPHPPKELVNSLLDQWIEKYKSLKKISDYPNPDIVLGFDCTNKATKRISTFDPINHEIKNWLKENVLSSSRTYSNWILRVLHVYSTQIKEDQRIQIYEKHLDSIYKNSNLQSNNYVLIYNITDSDGDLVFYQEEGKPLIREDRPVFLGTVDTKLHQLPHETLVFNNCVEIARYRPAPRTWYMSRIDVIHSVENANQIPRIALQLRLTDKEVLELIKSQEEFVAWPKLTLISK